MLRFRQRRLWRVCINCIGWSGPSLHENYLIFDPRNETFNAVVYATSKGSDQPAHMRILIRNCVEAVERFPVLHYTVDFIFLSFGMMGFIEEL